MSKVSKKKMKTATTENKTMGRIFYYPDMRGIGDLYQNQLNFKTNDSTLDVIQNEIKRMSFLNHILVDNFLNERPEDAFSKALEKKILAKIYTQDEIELLSEEEKRSSLVEILLPKEQDIFKVYRND